MVQDHEMDLEGCHVDQDRKNDETANTSTPVLRLISL